MILMPHNPREYAGFIESAGYRKVKDLYAWLYDLSRGVPDSMYRLAERRRAMNGLMLRPLDLRKFAREADQVRRLYAAAWARNWGFVPPTPAEFGRIANELKPIFDPRCAVCAEVGGQMVAVAIAIPDINQALKGTGGRLFPTGLLHLLRRRRYINQVRLILLGIEPAYRSYGLYPMLIAELHKQTQGGPYKRAEFSWVLEENLDINQPAERAGAQRYKTYRIYEKTLA
jgi:hypothetical protein